MAPGMEMAVPERTETSSGFSGFPNLRPEMFSNSSMCLRIMPWISVRSSGMVLMVSLRRKVSVVMTKPGGTGIPCR